MDFDAKRVEGKILVNVHYYEQGNVRFYFIASSSRVFIIPQVQLATTHDASFILPPAVTASSPPKQASEKLLALIEKEEKKYHAVLNDAYHEMSEKTFKGLRRALPLTRQKLDWDRVSRTHSCMHQHL